MLKEGMVVSHRSSGRRATLLFHRYSPISYWVVRVLDSNEELNWLEYNCVPAPMNNQEAVCFLKGGDVS